jgi:hypothetical protein
MRRSPELDQDGEQDRPLQSVAEGDLFRHALTHQHASEDIAQLACEQRTEPETDHIEHEHEQREGKRALTQPHESVRDGDARRQVSRQAPEIARDPCQRREHAPYDDRPGDDPDAIAAIGEPRDRNAENRVEERERETAERAELPVMQTELVFDLLVDDAGICRSMKLKT